MKKYYISVLLLLLITGCATYKAKYATAFSGTGVALPRGAEPIHTFYLIGDAGLSPMGGMNPVLQSFKTVLDKAGENSSAIFLGDNIYPAGFSDETLAPEAYAEAKNHLDAQLNTLVNFKGAPIFIPGNHDWYSDGLKGLERQEKYIESELGNKKVFFPEDGCPLEKIKIGNDILLIVIDTEWYLTDWDKHPTINDDCEIKNRGKLFQELEGLIKKNVGKTTLIAMHHPMFTYGSHGGQFSFKQGLYPSGGKIPYPILGSFANLLRKTSGASTTDVQNKHYNMFKRRMVTLAQYSEKVIFLSGHEHTLQYIVENNTPQIVSGSGAKKGATRLLNGSQFSSGQRGYAILKVFGDGSSSVDFYGLESDKEQLVYSTQVLPPNAKKEGIATPEDFPEFVEASIYAPEEVDKSGFFKSVWGERYREYYATKVKAPTVRLDTLFGGLVPVRKGGGHQSKSLRLQDKSGRQYVMRALRKSAELYLQAIAFQDQYVVGEFEGTYTEKLLLDFYTGSHPYAPFTIGPLSDAVGIYHTNPKLYYIPKQSSLGEYNKDFGNELYMIEEHVSDGHGHLASFGYANKIESTDDLIKKLRRDEKYRVDDVAYVRARLFDMMIGDWDRHVDQWRWAQLEEASGNVVFKPIPRDRDQVYSIMGDGFLMGVATRIIPTLRLFEGFNEEIRSVKGFNASPMTFALDMALLPETDENIWVAQARFIQENIDETVIDLALQGFPKEVSDATVAKIKKILLARKNNLVETAKEYYGIINKYSIVTGTDKDDHFVVNVLSDGKLDVKAFRIKKGRKADLFFSKVYDQRVTKEIWMYGLDDDDIFEINGNGKIKIRIIGGQNNDVYNINDEARAVHIYDFKSKKNTYDGAFGGKVHRLDDYEVNTYEFLKIKASTNQLLPSIGFNPDDGVRIGFSNVYTYNGFRQNPFTQQHTLNGAFYFATSGVDFSYTGEFANAFGKANLELAARFTSPNFSINFFGFGNETPNFDDDLDLDFNRVKIQTLTFAPSLVWRGRSGSKVSLGISYENYDVEETEGRFIDDFYTNVGRDTQQDFFGADVAYTFENWDNEAFPTLGMGFSLRGGYKTNLTESDRAFGYIIPSFSIDHRLVPNGKLVLATKFKAHFNIGDDYEFYQGASIGANDGLRGFRFQRFTGKTSYYQNTDIRLSFRKRQTGLLPVTPGIYGGFDYGRVWFPDDSSDKWHNSYGGGFFLNGADILSANFGLFNSSDGLRFAFGVGFGF
ncbi:MAG: metallophosphoesterase [Bacteroidota bacterium]